MRSFFSKNVDFSLKGKQCGFSKMYFLSILVIIMKKTDNFSDFASVCCAKKNDSILYVCIQMHERTVNDVVKTSF